MLVFKAKATILLITAKKKLIDLCQKVILILDYGINAC